MFVRYSDLCMNFPKVRIGGDNLASGARFGGVLLERENLIIFLMFWGITKFIHG